MGWKMVYNSLDKNREKREKMLLTFAKNSIRSKPPPSFRAVYHNKNHVITNTVYRDRYRLMKTVQYWTVRFHETSLLILSLLIILDYFITD